MKITLFLLFLSLFQTLASNGYSQAKISLDSQAMTVNEVLNTIEEQTEYFFLFNSRLIDVHRRVSIRFENEEVENALEKIFEGTDVEYLIKDRQIILTNQFSQLIKVSGKVTNTLKEPISGVTIFIKGTTQGVISDREGNYTLADVPGNATLVFSFVGMKKQEIFVNNQLVIDVVMEEETIGIDEVVAIGYGVVKKSDLTGSVSQIDPDILKHQSTSQITDLLTGTVAGIYANQSTSASGGSSTLIRGQNSIKASTSPLVVLDGAIFNGSLKDINPNDIETIDVLKDASSAAIFGAKAASGVIIITTTRGIKGKPEIHVSLKTGLTEALNSEFAIRSPDEYLEYRKNFYRTLYGKEPDYYWFSPDDLPNGVTLEQWRAANPNPDQDNTIEWLNRMNFFDEERENYLNGNVVDWTKEVMPVGLRNDLNVDISGGTENITYYWSLGYLNNEGIIEGDKFSAVRSRLNNEYKITDWLKAGINLQYTMRDESTVPASLNNMRRQSPFSQVFNEDGTVKWYPYGYVTRNPLIDTYGVDKLRKINTLFARLYAEVSLPFGFSYQFSFQPRIGSIKDYNFWSPQTILGGETYTNGYAYRRDYTDYEWMMDNMLKWNKTVKIHKFDLTLLYNVEKIERWENNLASQDLEPLPILSHHGIGYGNFPELNANDSKATGDAALARLNYTLNEKYLFTGSVRRDGYSAFGQKNPRATFPAAAFAWQVSKENFYNKNWLVNRAKLRVSWGKNGNRDIGEYAALARLGKTLYYNGQEVQNGLRVSSLANSSLRWEETESVNFGLDLGLFDNRVDLVLDYYLMSTSQLLINRALPRITGFTSISANLGQLDNKGFEMTMTSVNVDKPNFKWKSTFTYSMNRNELISLFGIEGEYILEGKTLNGEIPDFTNEWFPGHALDAIWDYDIIGTWQLGEEEEAAKYGLKPGDLKVRNLDDVEDYEELQDKTFIGHKRPRHHMGLMNEFQFLKNFQLNVFLRADLGHLRAFPQAVRGWSTYDRQNTENFPYWTFENQTNEWPRLNGNLSAYGGGIKLYKSTSFLRVQDVTLTYNMPGLNKVPFKSLSVFLSARNLFTFTKWPGFDPESGHTPMPRTYTFGIDFSL